MGYKQIYVLNRHSDDPAGVYHETAFGGIGYDDIESPSFTKRFKIIAMDSKTVTVQERDETV